MLLFVGGNGDDGGDVDVEDDVGDGLEEDWDYVEGVEDGEGEVEEDGEDWDCFNTNDDALPGIGKVGPSIGGLKAASVLTVKPTVDTDFSIGEGSGIPGSKSSIDKKNGSTKSEVSTYIIIFLFFYTITITLNIPPLSKLYKTSAVK